MSVRVRMGLLALPFAFLGGLVSGPAQAAEVYRSTGEFGEVTFSDLETPDAEPVTVDTPQPAAPAAADWVAQALDVARMLEQSRLAREAAAAERRDAQRKRQQAMAPLYQPEVRTSYGPWYPYPYAWRPGHPGYRPPHRPGGPHDRPGRPSQPRPVEPVRSPIPSPQADRDS